MRIVVDAMGGDYAPQVVVEGAIAAAKEYPVEIVLVGDVVQIQALLKKKGYRGKRIYAHPAQEVIGMSEPAALSVRKKRGSSIVLGLNLLKDGQADAFFSAGNTGAVVCAATLSLGTLPGIERPGIAVLIPTQKEISLVVDVGANIDAKPIHLLQYGIMADAYFRYILNKSEPRVGLLNIGEEESKGTEFIKETHQLLSDSHLNFIGNVEGRDLFSGKCDIILCDGFVGNVALKVSESVTEAVYELFKRSIKNNPVGMFGVALLSLSLGRLRKQIDYSEYGGAPLLGVNGVVIIGHGRSSAKAIKNAIRVAKEEVELKVNEKIIEEIKAI